MTRQRLVGLLISGGYATEAVGVLVLLLQVGSDRGGEVLILGYLLTVIATGCTSAGFWSFVSNIPFESSRSMLTRAFRLFAVGIFAVAVGQLCFALQYAHDHDHGGYVAAAVLQLAGAVLIGTGWSAWLAPS